MTGTTRPAWQMLMLVICLDVLASSHIAGASEWSSIGLINRIEPWYTSANMGIGHHPEASEGLDKYDNRYYAMYDPSGVAAKIVSIVDGHELDADVRPLHSTSSITVYLSIMFQRGGSRSFSSDNELCVEFAGAGYPRRDVYITMDGETYDAKQTSVIPLPRIDGVITSGEVYQTLTVSFVPHGPPVAPFSVETLSAVDVGETGATLRGRIVGGQDECEYWFIYWAEGQTPTTSLWKCCAAPGETFSVAVANLQPQTEYFYQAQARNDDASAAGATQTFTTGPHSPQEPPEKPAPGRLRIDNVHERFLTSTFKLIYAEGATEEPNDTLDMEYTRWRGIPPPFIVSKVGDKYLTIDARPPNSETPIDFRQMFHSDTGSARLGSGDTNALVFSFPDPNNNEKFRDRIITFQEYIPDPNNPNNDPNYPNPKDPNTETYPVYLIRDMIEADPNGQAVILLPDFERRIYAGTLHNFILRTDTPTIPLAIADFNKDGIVDANDYQMLENAIGQTGNSQYDIARLKDPEAEAGSDDYGAILIGHGGDGIVDEIDEQAFLELWAADRKRRGIED